MGRRRRREADTEPLTPHSAWQAVWGNEEGLGRFRPPRSPNGRKRGLVHSHHHIVFDFVTTLQFTSYSVDGHSFHFERHP